MLHVSVTKTKRCSSDYGESKSDFEASKLFLTCLEIQIRIYFASKIGSNFNLEFLAFVFKHNFYIRIYYSTHFHFRVNVFKYRFCLI
jgi:hypothetical protein